ncbi:tautomerase family protein, partial [Mycobacterium kubicae]|uniref:tautomerase family protein n=1 Tax=Mycobacterium kubicae TaxID=120959 RepID=UPI001A96A74B
MPLLYVDLIEGRTPAEVRVVLDAIHDAVVEAFGVPQRDRYQVVRTHAAHEIVALDTGLGIDRSARLVVLLRQVGQPCDGWGLADCGVLPVV